jgi:hypothetical protein
MAPEPKALSLTRSDEPGQLFEMIVYRYANGRATVNVFKVGKLARRNVAMRDASDPPRWAASGDVIEFAGEDWIPVDHDAAVAWMNDMDGSSDGTTTSAGDVADASLGGAGTPPTARTRLGSVASWVKGVGAILGILSIVGGIVLALYRDDFDEQPFVGAGVSSIVSGVVFWTFAYFAGTFAEAWLETTERTDSNQ